MKKFILDFFKAGFQTLLKFLLAFSIGTGAGGIVCWYYSIPLAFSLVGGILVLGIALALVSDSMLL